MSNPASSGPVNDQGGEGLIRPADRIIAPSNVRDGLQVGQFQQRVRWRFHRSRVSGEWRPQVRLHRPANPTHL